MSSDVAEPGGNGVPAALGELENAVERLLREHEAMRSRLAALEARSRELEATLTGVSTGELDPGAMAAELRDLRRENEDLSTRMADARESVQRVMTRLRFVEEDR